VNLAGFLGRFCCGNVNGWSLTSQNTGFRNGADEITAPNMRASCIAQKVCYGYISALGILPVKGRLAVAKFPI